MGAHDDMMALVANLRNVASVSGDATEAVGSILREKIDAMPAEQKGLTGAKWAPGIQKPNVLMNSPAAIAVSVIPGRVRMVLSGHHVWHQWGSGGNPVREMLPSAGLPPTIGRAIRDEVVSVVEEWLTRKGPHKRRAHKGKKWR